jgi:pimeloyl-ACP methyl ester carboxylesterase
MNEATRKLLESYPVGYYDFHPDANINFQMNRWLAWGEDSSMIEELRAISPRVQSHADFIREFLALAEKAEGAGAKVKAAYYWRGAEFFMKGADPRRKGLRARFIGIVRDAQGVSDADIERVPYTEAGAGASLPALRFGKGGAKGALLLHGGFDSYFEEIIAPAKVFAAEGYDVVLFEGPGQGGVLEGGLPMTHRWELPVRAVLDHFGLGSAALIGISLGGYLALRAAAFEPRIGRVVAWDVIYDAFDTLLSQLPRAAILAIKACLALRADALVDLVVRSRMGRDLVAQWGVEQGMRVFGAPRPSGFLRAIDRCSASSFSRSLSCDALLLAGAEDHFVPLETLYLQHRALSNARGVATRIFTKAQSAQGHCQVGNMGLALRVILDWLESTSPIVEGAYAPGPGLRGKSVAME